MSVIAPTKPDIADNPFVGPRSFRYGERLHGRDREISELRDVLIAQRIVLLYSPSGAGKSSLLEAGLRPELEQREFRVLPTIRVGHDVPPALQTLPVRNRYVLSTLLSLEEGRAPGRQLVPAELAQIQIGDYLARAIDEDGEQGTEPCLVFDQFEELFTLDPTDQEQKSAYLEELGIALRDRGRWALFAMREDFIAQLDPYLALIPKRFSSRYRLDLLGMEGAQTAMRRPAEEHGRPFSPEAATRLVDDLRQMRVQRGDTVVEEHGPYVEPVQLQVVCRQLWSSLPTDSVGSIEVTDVIALGKVDDALAGFYDDAVRQAAEDAGAKEREVRAWFEDDLITEQGFRAQVLDGPGERGPAVVRGLENAHVIRADSRRGINWYEISHDRLVAPIRASNAQWRDANLSTLQREAQLWDAQSRPAGLLITGDVLAEAEAWAAAHPDDLLPVDRDYLEASGVEERRVQSELRSSRRNKRLAVLSTTIGIIAVAALVAALLATISNSKTKARNEEDRTAAATEAVVRVLRSSEGSSPDLRGVDLPNAQLQHINLAYVGLTGAQLDDADFTGAALTAADLQGAAMSGVKLRGADLTGANLTGANLTDADLTLANLTDANLTSVVWDNATCPDGTSAGEHPGTCVDHLTPAGGTFSGDLVGLDLTLVDLAGVTFSDADLRLTRIDPGEEVIWIRVRCPDGRDSDTMGRTCENAREFAGGDFVDLEAPGITLTGDLAGADFTGADLTAARLSGTHLAGANLTSADLSDATLANLSADDLAGTSMGVKSLEAATLNSVDLRAVDLVDADTTDLFLGPEVCFDETTAWTARVDPSASQCNDADARVTLSRALFATDADDLLALINSPTDFEYLAEYLGSADEPGGLMPNGLSDYVEPPARGIVASDIVAGDDASTDARYLGFSLQLTDEIAARFADHPDGSFIEDGIVTTSVTVVRVGSEWRLEAGSFCGFLVQLENYVKVIVGSALPGRTPLDECSRTIPQAMIGLPQLAEG